MSTTTNPTTLYIDDFMTGLLSALALRGVNVLTSSGQRLDRAFSSISATIAREAAAENLGLAFRIQPDPVLGRTPVIYDALVRAARRKLISRDNPEFVRITLKVTKDEARRRLSRLPGNAEFYRRVAAEFLEAYSAAG